MLRSPCAAHSRVAAAHRQHAVHGRKIALAYAQQLTTVHSAATSVRDDDGKNKSTVPVQLTRPTLPCEKPLPLANVMEVQRLLYLLEAPEYCMRAFREHGVNGQDLLHMQAEDLEDSRFKFPRHVQRKVLRVAEAWRSFQALSGGATSCALSLEQLLDLHRGGGRPPEVLSQLQAAFFVLDVNNNRSISFEEFLVGYSLLKAAGVQTAAPAASSDDDDSPAPRADTTNAAASPAAPTITTTSTTTNAAVAAAVMAVAPTAPLPALSPAVDSAYATAAEGGSLWSNVANWFRS